jgi:hypothetical protein
MKLVVVIMTIVCGILFILVPRYILPACEFVGHPRMHCSDTARAEQVVGALLIAVSIATFLMKPRTTLISAIFSAVLFGIALWLPDKFGYCLSPGMPCHYGMVPAVRFLSVIGILTMLGVIVIIARSARKKGSS